MAFGLGNDGFTIKRETDIIADLEEGFKAAFGEINVAAESVFGQIIGVTSKPLAELWELMDIIYLSQYPASAEGFSLDGVAQLTGITRLGPTKTLVTGILNGDQGTSILEGNSASIDETEEIFFTVEDVTIDKASVLKCVITVDNVLNNQLYTVTIDSIGYSITSDADATETEILGSLATEINNEQDEVTAVATTTDMTITVDDLITPFSVDVDTNLSLDERWTPVEFEAQNTGSVLAVAGSLTNIETPIAGWDSVDNLTDGVIGNDTETDTELRIRRELSLRILGAATIPAITARLLQEVSGVTGVKVVENDTPTYNDIIVVEVTEVANTTDYSVYINGIEFTYTSDASATEDEITAGLVSLINGSPFALTATDNVDGTFDVTPDQSGIIFSFSHSTRLDISGATSPHTIESVVEGGTDQDVADKIWEVKAGGIGTHGNTSKIVTDSEGDEHLIKFTRPTKQYAWVDVEYTLNPEENFPADGEQQIIDNIYVLGITFNVGDDFILIKFYSPINAVEGIADVTLTIAVTDTPGGTPSYGSTNIPISGTQVLAWDKVRITVAEA